MAKVIRPFRDKTDNLKRYNVGDEYPEVDAKRVAFLIDAGFLERSAGGVKIVTGPGEEISPFNKPKRRKKGVNDDGDPYG